MFSKVRVRIKNFFSALKLREVEVIEHGTSRWRAVRASTLGSVLGALLLWLALPLVESPHVPALAIAPQLFTVGEYLCQQNKGLRRVEITLPVRDHYTFICGNGARFEDTFARIKRQ